ncbi:ovochymase [Polyergus mexicanus]|uniref:ovochymase n=1 Tax=Polyergus mexicanus TaxID=615972 RepID=UPI0038B4C727
MPTSGSMFVKLLSLLIVSINAQSSRTDCRVDGQVGACISARECPIVSTILQQSRDQAIAYLRHNHCGFEGNNPLVCCIGNANINIRPSETIIQNVGSTPGWNPQPSSSPINETIIQVDLADNPLLPRDCGRDLSQRIVGGERTELDEFPWMALLEYQKPNGRTTACGGVLINKRYVLTAAHCIKGKDLPPNWRLTSVRLGEYDTDTERDCVQDSEDSVLCADNTITVGVEEQIAHEEYRPLSRDQRYDIALLRLSRDVAFTNFVKPICLPSNSSLNGKLVVAGWGKTEIRSASNVKLKLALPLADKDQCDQIYSNAGVRLGYGQMCAGGQKGKDSCRGDSGGPLMSVERIADGTGRWAAVGVVSFGPSPCGMQDWPGVYTRVVDFVPWIISKLVAEELSRSQLSADESMSFDSNRFQVDSRYCAILCTHEATDQCESSERNEKNLRLALICEKEKKRGGLTGRIIATRYTTEINMIFIRLFVLYLAITAIDAQNECSDSRATCINIRNCANIIAILRDSPRPLSPEILQMLRDAQCGFEGNDPMICCVSQRRTTLRPTLSTIITLSLPTTTKRTMEQEIDVSSPPDVTNHPNLRLLDLQKCGPVIQQKVYGGNKTGVFDFPWMALIAYDTGKPNPEFRCGGTVISDRFILTAAHCVTQLPADIRSLIGVRVGDHDISKERDCDYDENGLEVQCAERYQDFGVESFYYHPDYTRTKLQNDIALIKLNSSIDFRPLNVKPICLPLGSTALTIPKKAIVTGWGATELGPRSQDLLQAKLPLVPTERCKEVYKRSTQIWYKQLCAGGLNVDSCFGDSGGPLQAIGIYNGNTIRTIQHGVVSYGVRECGTAGIPGVYTRVAYYMDWILNTMTD